MTAWPWNSGRAAVTCRRCGAGYTEHEPGGGPCREHDCEGFLWVDPEPAPGELENREAYRS